MQFAALAMWLAPSPEDRLFTTSVSAEWIAEGLPIFRCGDCFSDYELAAIRLARTVTLVTCRMAEGSEEKLRRWLQHELFLKWWPRGEGPHPTAMLLATPPHIHVL